MRHVFGLDEGVEFFGGEEAELDGGFAEADIRMMGGFGDLSGVVIAKFGSEGGDEHKRIAEVMIDLLAVGLNAGDAMIDETVARVGEKLDGTQIIGNHHRLEDV